MSAGLQTREPFAGYTDEEKPFGGYVVLSSVFTAALAGALVAAARRDRLSGSLSVDDVVRMGFATHKLARLIAKSSVSSFIRAPFVRLEDQSGANSIAERPRGEGLRRSLGELLICTECTGQWVAGGLLAGMLHAPRATRSVTSLYTALALADLLQYVYVGVKERA